jgi:hypothetical protein
MPESPGPKRIVIAPDDYHAKWVGRTREGLQFFATSPFTHIVNEDLSRLFVAMYLWNADGIFQEARITDMGVRETMSVTENPFWSMCRQLIDWPPFPTNSAFTSQTEASDTTRREYLEALGEFDIAAIEVAPFQLERFGVTFGLIYTKFEESEWVELQPGDYMAFGPPWDGGYAT